MARHVFAAIVTGHGTAANNRGLTEGNVTTLQKIVWNGEVHTTVSAEAIRFALRRHLAEAEECNRMFDDNLRVNTWRDAKFERWGATRCRPLSTMTSWDSCRPKRPSRKGLAARLGCDVQSWS